MITFKNFLLEHGDGPTLHIASKLAKAFNVPTGAAQAYLVGGDHPRMGEFMKKIEDDGYDGDGGWTTNEEFFKKHGVSKDDYYMALVVAHTDVDVDDEHEVITTILKLMKKGRNDEARALYNYVNDEGYDYDGLEAIGKSLNAGSAK